MIVTYMWPFASLEFEEIVAAKFTNWKMGLSLDEQL